jgi:predicted transcriptional regulator
MEETVTASNRRINDHVRKHSGTLAQHLGISEVDVQVLFYLFDNKVYGPKPAHSAYETCRSLQSNQLANNIAGINGNSKKISAKSVNESLKTLMAMGIVKVIKLKGKGRGRPAKELYELKSIQEVIRIIEGKIEEKRRFLLGVFGDLSNEEETISMMKQESRT